MRVNKFDVLLFRKQHEIMIHRLLPMACAYVAAVQDGDPILCDIRLDEIAGMMLAHMLPQPVGNEVEADDDEELPDNVTPLRG